MQNLRFWSKVNKTDTCWLWTAALQWNGYGQYRSEQGKTVKAHRFSFELANGKIPDNLCVLHTCDVPSCVNPDHLRLGTQKDNIKDKVNKSRQNKGETSPLAFLCAEQVLEIRDLWKTNKYTQRKLSKMFGISNQHVSDLINKKRWKHI